MNYTKTIVCLANSRKHSGRCIAGKEVITNGYGGWIRPVSARPSAEVSEEERRYENGQDPQVLDILSVPLIAATPLIHQTENHVIDQGYYWTKKGKLPWTELRHLVDDVTTIWANGDSSYSGLNDRVRLEQAAKLTTSIMLIKPDALTIQVQTEGAEFGTSRRRVRAHFKYRGTSYILIVTDPVTERAFLVKPNGDYPLKSVYLCVSLGEAHTECCC